MGKERKRFGPWRGYRSSVTAYDCAPNELPTGSYNYLVDPFDGRLRKRKGSSVLLDSVGLLEYAPTPAMTGVKLFGLTTYANGGLSAAPTQACLFASEDTPTYYGTLWWNRSGNKVNLGQESSGSYPTLFKPWVSKYGLRYSTAALRMLPAAGSRNCITLGDRVYFPNYANTPQFWNKLTGNGSSGFTTERIRPTGMIQPLVESTITQTAPAGGTSANWPASKRFAYCWAYKDVTGAWSMPTTVRVSNANLLTGIGIFDISATAPNKLVHSNVPIGPDGTVQRALLRTPLVATTVIPDLTDFRVAGYINNNTQTTYDDYLGVDDNLEINAFVFDNQTNAAKKLPPRSRYYWTARGRVYAGCLRPNTCGLLIAPYSGSTFNVNDDDATSITPRLYVKVSGTTMTFYFWDGVAGHADANWTLTLTSAKTLQDVCDEINAHAATAVPTDGTNVSVRASVAAGADPNQPSVVGGTSVIEATGNADNFTSSSGSRTGTQRAYSQSWPAVLHLTDTILDVRLTDGKRAVEFTKGDPGYARFNVMHWDSRNRRELPEDMGTIVGGGEVFGGSVVCATGGIMLLSNTRDSDTGADDDIDWRTINKSRGCIAPFSIVQGEGWVGYMTAEGYVVTDGEKEVLISGDVWDAGSGRGEWAYEIQASLNAVEADTMASKFFACRVGSKLAMSYRTASTTGNVLFYDYSPGTAANGLAQVLRPNGDTYGWSTPLNYGTVLNGASSIAGKYGCLGIVKSTDATHLYMEVGQDGDNATTFDGLIYEIEDASETTDQGSKRFAAVWGTPIIRGPAEGFRERLSFVRADVLHYTEMTNATTPQIIGRIYKNDGTASGAVFDLTAAAPQGSQGAPKRTILRSNPASRGPCENFQFRENVVVSADGTGAREVHGVEIEYNVLGGAL